MKEIAINEVNYWTSNIQKIKKISPKNLHASSEVKRGQVGGSAIQSVHPFLL